MAKVSVIVPVYNAEKYLDACFGSIAKQEETDLEVILVDDGSTDASGEICDRFVQADTRFRVIHQENKGLVGARKAGIRAASGTYICYVDSDDEIDPDFIRRLREEAERCGADLVCGAHYSGADRESRKAVFPAGLPSGVYDGERMEELRANMLCLQAVFFRFGIMPSVWAKLFRRDMLLEHQTRVPEEITVGEDAAVTYPYLLQAKSVSVAPEICGYHYRETPQSMTRAVRESYFSEISHIWLYLKEVFSRSDFVRDAGDDDDAVPGSSGDLKRQLECYRYYLMQSGVDKLRAGTGAFTKERRAFLERAAENAIFRAEEETDVAEIPKSLKRRMRQIRERRFLIWEADCLAGRLRGVLS